MSARYSSDSVSEVITSSTVPTRNRPSTRYSTRSTYGRTGLTSWVTNSTAVSASRRRGSISADTSRALAGSRFSSGSSHSSSTGSAGQRLRDPDPLQLAAGHHTDAAHRPGASPLTCCSARRTALAFGRPIGAGVVTPQRWPSIPEPDEVAAAQRSARGRPTGAGARSRCARCPLRPVARDGHGARAQRQLSEQHLEQ